MALPAGLVCTGGLLLQERHLLPLGGWSLARWLRLAAVSAALSGLALGLMAPAAGPWPNTDWLLGAPAEVWGGLAGLLFALARILAVFQREHDHALEVAERQIMAAQAASVSDAS